MTRESRKERYRQEILVAAERVFAEKGYQSARIEEIAEEVDFSPASLYSYFDSKEDLFVSLLEDRLEELWGQLPEVDYLTKDFESVLRDVLRKFCEFGDRYRNFLRIFLSLHMSGTIGHSNKRMQKFFRSYLQFMERMAKIMQKGIDEGALLPIPAEILALYLMSYLEHFSTYKLLYKEFVYLYGDGQMPFIPAIVKDDESDNLVNYVEGIIDFFLDGARKR